MSSHGETLREQELTLGGRQEGGEPGSMEGDTEGLSYLCVAEESLGGGAGSVASTGGARLSRHLQQQREGQVSQRLSNNWGGLALAASTGQTSLIISDQILHTSLAGNGKDCHHQLVHRSQKP